MFLCGLKQMKSEQISEFLQSRIDAKDFPSAVYLVAEKGEIIFQDALGFAVVEPKRIEARIDTIYDLASLTKPLVTGLLCAKLIENGEIKLNDKISKFFDQFNIQVNTEEKREITIENLLTHTSGFIDWLPFYSETFSSFENSQRTIDRIAQKPLVVSNNSTVIYSDLNFILLGKMLKEIYGNTLNYIAHEEIAIPLSLKKTFYINVEGFNYNSHCNSHKSYLHKIAASEKGNEFEKQTCIEKDFPIRSPETVFRNHIIWGEVHDGNCYFMNGVSGHAGLFSTAEETFKIAQQFLPNYTTLLKPETCELFRTNFTPNLNEARSIAFQLAATPESTASNALSKDSFGHLGFTGTSLWIEPETERIFILLTNRTHARTLPFVNINSVRRKFHELATHALNENAKI